MKKKHTEQEETGPKAGLKKIRHALRWADPFTYSDILLKKAGKQDSQTVSWIVYLVTAFVSAYLLYYVILGLLFNSPSPMVIVVSGSMEPVFHRGDVMALSRWNIEELNAQLVELPETAIEGKNIEEYAETWCSVKGLNQLVPCKCPSALQNPFDSVQKNFDFSKCGPLVLLLKQRVISSKDILTEKIFFPSTGKEIEVKKEGDVVVYFSEIRGIPVIHRAVVKIRAKDGLFVLTKGDSELNSFIDQEDNGLSVGAVKVSELQGKTIFMVPIIGYVKLILLDDLPCYLFAPNKQYCRFP